MNYIITLLTTILTLNANYSSIANLKSNLNSIDNYYNSSNNSIINSSYSMDIYEPNDNYEIAKCLAPDAYYNSLSYSNVVESTFDYIGHAQDVDYYYIPVLNDSMLSLNINTKNTNDYFDYELYKYEYNTITNNTAPHNLKSIKSNFKGTHTADINMFVNPGTYLLYLRGKQTNYNANTIHYSIKLNVTYKQTQENIIVKDLLSDSSINGAIWISDFIPANDNTILNVNKKVMYYKYNTEGLLYPDYTLDDLMKISMYKPIKIADFMIWDPVLRICLSNIISTLNNEVLKQLEQRETVKGYFELVYNVTSNSLSIVSHIAGLTPQTKPIAVGAELIEYIGLPTIKAVFTYMVPNLNVNMIKYTNYLTKLESYLNPKLNANLNSVSDIRKAYDEKYKQKEIISFPIFLNFNKSNPNSIRKIEHFYTTELYKIDAEYNFVKHTSILNVVDKENVLKGGKIYKIKNISTITNINNLDLATNHTHIYKNHYCAICNQHTEEHDYYDFNWYDNNYHTSLCYCGSTTLQGHAISMESLFLNKTKKYCLFCGGPVDTGFIKYNNISQFNYMKKIIINDLTIINNLNYRI